MAEVSPSDRQQAHRKAKPVNEHQGSEHRKANGQQHHFEIALDGPGERRDHDCCDRRCDQPALDQQAKHDDGQDHTDDRSEPDFSDVADEAQAVEPQLPIDDFFRSREKALWQWPYVEDWLETEAG